jgi:hypothetical protein
MLVELTINASVNDANDLIELALSATPAAATLLATIASGIVEAHGQALGDPGVLAQAA